MDADLEKRFEKAVLDAYCDAVNKCGIRETRLLVMIEEYGAVRTVKKILANNQFVYRAIALSECGCHGCSMEHVVLRPEFEPLFTEQERMAARTRINGKE